MAVCHMAMFGIMPVHVLGESMFVTWQRWVLCLYMCWKKECLSHNKDGNYASACVGGMDVCHMR